MWRYPIALIGILSGFALLAGAIMDWHYGVDQPGLQTEVIAGVSLMLAGAVVARRP